MTDCMCAQSNQSLFTASVLNMGFQLFEESFLHKRDQDKYKKENRGMGMKDMKTM